ncbi:hypothetical protein BRC83_06950 [Halobacteriales archaeon QS_1_68_17]|nr:MAG: hypothetical protein BRC83_06950 [Halobacteriales archaeon QS_1_68_17]
MDAHATIGAYYDALRAGEPLAPFFADSESVVKFGISERLTGHGELAAGLRAQTETTTGWTVESEALSVTARDCHAWFSDDVRMAWTDTTAGIRYDFDTRWSGTLERAGEDREREQKRERQEDAGDTGSGTDGQREWEFVGMHVSTAGDL